MQNAEPSPLQQVTEVFEAVFKREPPLIARAPGRVNLIGEHTDYNEGFVLPMAIDRGIWLAAEGRSDRRVVIHALDFDEIIEFDLDHLNRDDTGVKAYVQGMAWALLDAGLPLNGFSGVLKGNIPIGAGLSSSAALELALARMFAAVSGIEWTPVSMAFIAQKAENEWVGVQCGIMDQMISAVGQADSALLIDCRSLETESVPLPHDCAIVVMDTGTRRGETGLIDSAYNDRRKECEEAARQLGVNSLRDVSLEQLDQAQADSTMDYELLMRAVHVVSENLRTLRAREVMLANDPRRLGTLMRHSHESLRDYFEVSSGALNAMVEIALHQDGCFGARMTGGGFAGCAIALVERAAADDFMRVVSQHYRDATGIDGQLYLCRAVGGAELIGNG